MCSDVSGCRFYLIFAENPSVSALTGLQRAASLSAGRQEEESSGSGSLIRSCGRLQEEEEEEEEEEESRLHHLHLLRLTQRICPGTWSVFGPEQEEDWRSEVQCSKYSVINNEFISVTSLTTKLD